MKSKMLSGSLLNLFGTLAMATIPSSKARALTRRGIVTAIAGMACLFAGDVFAGISSCMAFGSGTCTTPNAVYPDYLGGSVYYFIDAPRPGYFRIYDTVNGVTVGSGRYPGAHSAHIQSVGGLYSTYKLFIDADSPCWRCSWDPNDISYADLYGSY